MGSMVEENSTDGPRVVDLRGTPLDISSSYSLSEIVPANRSYD